MRIRLHKRSGDRHELEIVRDDGARESVVCETRSYLVHDLLHYAVESEAGIDHGFWGALAAGRTLAELDDRDAPPTDPAMWMIESVVGALTGAAKGAAAEDLVAGIARNADALDYQLPPWLTVDTVRGVIERMRRLQGHWRATGYGAVMELPWPATSC